VLFQNPSPSVCLAIWRQEEMGGNQSKNTPLECMINHFKTGFNGHYGVKLTPNKLNILCEVDWPAFGVGWPPEGSLDKLWLIKFTEQVLKKKKKKLTPRRMGKARRLKLIFKDQTLFFI
jgi:hypothetical protein